MLKLTTQKGIQKVSFHHTRRLNTLIAEPLREELVKLVTVPGTEVVLSMEGINFIDSSGFETLMDVVERSNQSRSRFRICDVSQEVYELLRLMKLDFVFEINPGQRRELSGVT